ncbi:AAA family ATPase [Sorangium sp. So ce542]|uniref:AAA family ATPase n=1 Tax=Sorangium sp. So ce542 TaxID=3133316 RepID=UPI003F6017CD
MTKTKEKRAEKPPQITSVFVGGFKSLRDRTEVALRPLTLLAGRNSSGKSSVMQALLLLKQTLEAPFDPGPLRLDGPNVRFTDVEQLFWRGARKGDTAQEFSIGFRGVDWSHGPRIGSRQELSVVFRRGDRPHDIALDRLEFEDLDAFPKHQGVLREDMSARELRALNKRSRLATPVNPSIKLQLGVQRNRCFLSVTLTGPGGFDWGSVLPPQWLGPTVPVQIERMIHLPGLRENPERSYPLTEVGRSFPGSFHHYTASVIASWQEQEDMRQRKLGEFLALLGLSWKAEARRLDATHLEVRVGRLPSPAPGGANDLVNVADVGVGVSQTLPLLVALLSADPGQIVYVEQPEIHLHPRAQVALARCLLDAAERGVIVVVETHSNLLLKGVQLEVARGADPKLVKLHWFARDKAGATQVTTADLDQQGAFGDWPEDFADVELDVESSYLRASLRAAGA